MAKMKIRYLVASLIVAGAILFFVGMLFQLDKYGKTILSKD